MLNTIQRQAFECFVHETSRANSLVVDRTQPNAPESIAAVGFALAAYPVGVERLWIDFRGIQDAFMRDKGIDCFENGRRATYVQQQYAIINPHSFVGYGLHFWGLTSSDGPGRTGFSNGWL